MLLLHAYLLLPLVYQSSLCRHPTAHYVGQHAPTGCLPAKHKAWGGFGVVSSASCSLQETGHCMLAMLTTKAKRVGTLTQMAEDTIIAIPAAPCTEAALHQM